MRKHEIERWLCGPDTLPITPAEIARALGVSPERLAAALRVDVAALESAPPARDERLRPFRLTVAVLRDVYAHDTDVWHWLRTPHLGLGGRPIDVLLTRDPLVVEEMVLSAWLGDPV